MPFMWEFVPLIESFVKKFHTTNVTTIECRNRILLAKANLIYCTTVMCDCFPRLKSTSGLKSRVLWENVLFLSIFICKNKIIKKRIAQTFCLCQNSKPSQRRTTQDTGTIKGTEQQNIATHSIQPVKTTESLCVWECVWERERVAW